MVASVVVNTTQFGNFTIEWEDFSLITCAVPTTINVSLFTCAASARYLQVDDLSCLEETSIDFNETTCQAATTVAMSTNVPSITTEQITTATSPMIGIQVNNNISFFRRRFSGF